MTLTISELFNQDLNKIFFQEFTPEKPSADSVFSRVSKIALHSLQTGILILEFQNPQETRLRKIPPSLLTELRNTVQVGVNEDVQKMIQNVVSGIRQNPSNYDLKPFVCLDAEDSTPLHLAAQVYFAKLLARYPPDHLGQPTNPYFIVDVVSHIHDDEELRGTNRVIIKGNETEVMDRWNMFHNFVRTRAREYMSLIHEAATFAKNHKSRDAIYAPLDFAHKLQAELAKQDSFFKEFVIEYDKLFMPKLHFSTWELIDKIANPVKVDLVPEGTEHIWATNPATGQLGFSNEFLHQLGLHEL